MTDSFERGLDYCANRRPHTPPLYNPSRAIAKPIPSLVFSIDQANVQSDSDEIESDSNSTIEENSENDIVTESQDLDENSNIDEAQQTLDENVDDENVGAETSDVENSDEVESNAVEEPQNAHENENDDEIQQVGIENGNAHSDCEPQNENEDPKHVLGAVDIDAEDESAIISLLELKNKVAKKKDGKIYITQKIDNDLEMTYVYGEKPKALAPLYQIKINDVISANIPFKENVSMHS